jgi:hypothetical protein
MEFTVGCTVSGYLLHVDIGSHCRSEVPENKRILLPVRHLYQWIEQNVLLFLKQAPCNKRDPQLVPAAGSCVECPKRTGNNKLLFAELSENEAQCTDLTCYAAKLEAHVQKQLTAKPELVQIIAAYGGQAEGSKIVTRNKYVEIRQDKAESPEQAKRPELKTCKYTAEAIIAEALEKGEVRQVCTQSDCPIHHLTKQPTKADASFKAEQDRRRRGEGVQGRHRCHRPQGQARFFNQREGKEGNTPSCTQASCECQESRLGALRGCQKEDRQPASSSFRLKKSDTESSIEIRLHRWSRETTRTHGRSVKRCRCLLG